MKFEFSAGGIVFDDSGNVLVCQHSQHHGWVFPKGLIDKEKKEAKEQAALREVEEETGTKGEITKALEPVTYWYVMDNQKIKKTVYYFLMKSIGGDITKHDFEMEAVEWIPKEKVGERLTYKSDKQVWTQAQNMIKSKS